MDIVQKFCSNINYYGFLTLPKYIQRLFVEESSKEELSEFKNAQKILGYKRNLDDIERKVEKIPCVTDCQLKLNPHQLMIIGYMLEQRALLVIHSTGSGKTLSAVVTSQCLLKNKTVKSVLVVSPKSLLSNFIKEIGTYMGESGSADPRYEFVTYEMFRKNFGKKKQKYMK